MIEQLVLDFEARVSDDALVQTMSASEIFDGLSVEQLGRFGEDRRVELKRASVHVDELAQYYSMFSNTSPDGGVLILGVENDGTPSGCLNLSRDQLNNLEKLHRQAL
jgi:ATP-dependent DNA helicase RecG